VLASQALLNVLSASRYLTVVDELRALFEGRFGTPPGPLDPTVKRAVALVTNGGVHRDDAPANLDRVREQAAGLAASEEELLLLALFGDEAEPLLETIRGRAGREDSLARSAGDQTRAERIREIVRVVQESGVGEITIEEEGMRVSVRRTPEPFELLQAPAALAGDESADAQPAATTPSQDGFVRVEAPMVGTFYRAPHPGAPPFVEEGDAVATGQTLCILEAMKLMNEVKAEVEGIVRAIHVRNAEAVEYGQLLFELEPVHGRPLDAL
jgi:oxaloacetate decarboxylase alpha subunit